MKDFGVIFQKNFKFDIHINVITSRAYETLVRPILYVSIIKVMDFETACIIFERKIKMYLFYSILSFGPPLTRFIY